MGHDLALLIPEIAVLLTAVGALIAEMLRWPRVALAVAIVGLFIATGLTLSMLGTDAAVFGGSFRIDTLSIWAKLILLPATVLSLLLARVDVRGTVREGTVYSLLCFATFGALVLAGSGDMMFLVLGVLLTSLASFALVAYPDDDPATEAAMKYFVFGSVTGAVMVFGLSYWFGAAGSTLLSDLARADAMPLAAILGLVTAIVGLGYKASLVPFHFWVPDAYQGGPLSIAAYLSVVPKVGALFALTQVLRDLPMESGWPAAIAGLAVLSMTYGYLAALAQDNVVRLLAYSSIAQSGYFLLGILAVGSSALALPSIILFAAAYAAMNLGAFAIVAMVGRTLTDFNGLGRNRPLMGIAMVLFLLSLVGIPPLAGFVGKFLIFAAVIDAQFTWLAVVGIVNSVLSLAVYLRIIVPMYRQGEAAPNAPEYWLSMVAITALSGTVIIGLAAQFFLVIPMT
ncbi:MULTISPECIES: NADH-quinone oxidoreductase subunit N [Gammaproteobacteria]|uniref:NADH-quinone oxidoreductase subunit N n=1 Tax=Alloalcanivorax gelatiniphagus TaxID=1194167 RepID=A0ABY2XJ89_9GAMM|nr:MULTISPECIES: NADH-quinone oxidoreductase subunit N [Alloalcanivorax]ASK36320.1 oxidoreductase [Alcanivorax sp. N3-2A]MCH2559316.1 NADH-quinone oxidoreductase subunit N [Alcanivorax sp.]MBM7335555.1 NADH-quinone oxidoreductase subunit N [Alloalcanivorax marinus]MCU5787719.1 NADH dehydrogenase (quinone) [Alloalcanivorax marinus]TMW11576.1 NADH-quinone oxidoreductase subunit N [Alloalcanivorax gelatiniphagus]|tara:strand:+ start:8355 stop:9719 length:1365 start_codon:yes stop_codon:yes gene_type:complete